MKLTSAWLPQSTRRGQVLPAALPVLIIVCIFFYFMVNSGQVVTEKIRVTNAADAAAYSAAIVEARALNFDAYMNRGVIANQMAIAQMVSFASWIDYFAHSADNIVFVAPDIDWFMLPEPRVIPLEAAFGGSEYVAEYFGGRSVGEYAKYVIDALGLLVVANDAASMALAASETVVQANVMWGVRQAEVAKKIVQAMDPSLNAEIVPPASAVPPQKEFDDFTKSWADDDRDRLKQVAMRSRDLFARERNWTINGISLPLFRNNPSLKKRGGTDLIDYDEWRGMDTLELHGQKPKFGFFGFKWGGDVHEPVGWGGIEVDAGRGDAGQGYHGNAYADNNPTAGRAESVMRRPDYTVYHGLPAVREIADTDPTHDAVTGISVRVWKKQADTLTSGGASQFKPSGDIQQFDEHPAAGEIDALSRAQVFFDRIAARTDGKTERGSLYNPYWRVRLAAPLDTDRAYVALKQGGLGLPSIP